MSAIEVWFLALLLGCFAVSVIWCIQYRYGNAGIVDVAWPFIVGGMGLLYALLGSAPGLPRALLVLLCGLWALRLGCYLGQRNLGQHEDSRYAQLKEKWGQQAQLKMWLFYLLQVVAAWLLSVSFLVIAFSQQTPAMIWCVLGLAIGLLGILGEGLADHQLKSFLTDPDNRGKVCDVGLWAYSRHPNYFFEIVHWAGYGVLAVASSWWLFGWLGFVLITLLLLKFSGIPTLENDSSSKREGWDEYVNRTNLIIPGPPRKN